MPLAVTLTAANRNDITQLLELVDRVPPIGAHGRFRPRRCSRIAPTTRPVTGANCAPGASRRESPNAAAPSSQPSTAPDSESSAGLSNARSPGCTTSAASPAATTGAPTSTKHSSRSAAPSSANNNSPDTRTNSVRASYRDIPCVGERAPARRPFERNRSRTVKRLELAGFDRRSG